MFAWSVIWSCNLATGGGTFRQRPLRSPSLPGASSATEQRDSRCTRGWGGKPGRTLRWMCPCLRLRKVLSHSTSQLASSPQRLVKNWMKTGVAARKIKKMRKMKFCEKKHKLKTYHFYFLSKEIFPSKNTDTKILDLTEYIFRLQSRHHQLLFKYNYYFLLKYTYYFRSKSSSFFVSNQFNFDHL